jgi:hypothetical protein
VSLTASVNEANKVEVYSYLSTNDQMPLWHFTTVIGFPPIVCSESGRQCPVIRTVVVARQQAILY